MARGGQQSTETPAALVRLMDALMRAEPVAPWKHDESLA